MVGVKRAGRAGKKLDHRDGVQQFKELSFCPEESWEGAGQGSERVGFVHSQHHSGCSAECGPTRETAGRSTREEAGCEIQTTAIETAARRARRRTAGEGFRRIVARTRLPAGMRIFGPSLFALAVSSAGTGLSWDFSVARPFHSSG